MAHDTNVSRRSVLAGIALAPVAAARRAGGQAEPGSGAPGGGSAKAVQVQYLEIVTPDVEATCRALSRIHGVEFGEPVQVLGNARTAALAGGGLLGVRAPLRDDEEPVTRPYVLVDDVEAATAAAREAGAEIAIPPLELPGQGTFALYILGGVQHGLWQL
jgi:predicted enzyme related to lactoylglutathione lyase